MKQRNLALTPIQRAAASQRIFARVEASEAFAAAQCVAAFCALPDEPQTDGVLARWRAFKRLVVPKVEGETMQFYDYVPDAMQAGAFGIAEPVAGALPCSPAEIDLILVPGTAFTSAGARMGRGRGFYDKYLASAGFHAVKIGVCYAHQIVAWLPVEAHDVSMDEVVSG